MPIPPRVHDLIAEAKKIAREYYDLTGRPLGITGEVAELEAARVLGLALADVRQAGFDATRLTADGVTEHLQIKGRCAPQGSSTGQRVGSIQLNRPWDYVILVLLDERLELQEIHEADRAVISQALLRPGSVARNERGALSVQAFKRIGRRLWPEGESDVPQDRESGAAGNDFGHQTAPKIASAIGATMIGRSSNEATWRAQRVVIKCARPATTSVGVTHAMLDRLDAVLAAFQRTDGRFDIFEMSPDIFRREMRPSRSTGAAGRVGVVTRRAFQEHGQSISTVATD